MVLHLTHLQVCVCYFLTYSHIPAVLSLYTVLMKLHCCFQVRVCSCHVPWMWTAPRCGSPICGTTRSCRTCWRPSARAYRSVIQFNNPLFINHRSSTLVRTSTLVVIWGLFLKVWVLTVDISQAKR